MMPEQTPMFSELPMDNPDAAKKEKSCNILQEIFVELMTDRNVQVADIHKATGIPFPTLADWYQGKVQTQKLDRNILKLAKYFNVSIEYLGFGIGSDAPPFESFPSDEDH